MRTTNGFRPFRNKLRKTNNKLCMNIADNLPDSEIQIIMRNLKQTEGDWSITVMGNGSSPIKELAEDFVKGLTDYQIGVSTDDEQQVLLGMLFSIFQLMGGSISSVSNRIFHYSDDKRISITESLSTDCNVNMR